MNKNFKKKTTLQSHKEGSTATLRLLFPQSKKSITKITNPALLRGVCERLMTVVLFAEVVLTVFAAVERGGRSTTAVKVLDAVAAAWVLP